MPYFIQLIKKYMQDNELHNAKFARLIHRSESTVCNYLNGKREPNHNDFRAILCFMYSNKTEKQNTRDRKKALNFAYWGQ